MGKTTESARVKQAKTRPYGRDGHQPVFGFNEPDPGFAFCGVRTLDLAILDLDAFVDLGPGEFREIVGL